MSNVAEILPLRLQERLDTLGKTKRGVSLAIGAHAGYVRDLLDPDRFNVPSATRIEALAEELDTTTDYLLGKVSTPDQVLSEVALSDRKLDFMHRTRAVPDEPGIPLLGTGDCADLELTDDEGQEVLIERSSFDADYHVRMIERPPSLRGARNAYAIYFQGSSMEPRFFAGEIGIVDPDRPASPGDFVLVQMNNGQEDHVVSVLVKRLVRKTSKVIELEQFNPPMVFEMEARRVARIHKIMPPTDLLFR